MIADEDMATAGVLQQVCGSIDGIEPAGTVRSVDMLMVRLRRVPVDLILLDITGDLGGLDTVDRVRQESPDTDILLLYHPDRLPAHTRVRALEKGIDECIDKTVLQGERTRKEFRLHLVTLFGMLQSRKRLARPGEARFKNRFFLPRTPRSPRRGKDGALALKPEAFRAKVVVIASSTGGPEILTRIFSLLPADLGVPILLVQHMPQGMTRYFAENLDKRSELSVSVADEGMEILTNRVYVAPAGLHMRVSLKNEQGRRFIRLMDTPPIKSVKPSADVLFSSAARSWGRNVLAVVLTGMGEDGKEGVAALKEKSCACLTQAAETCVVYGMPRAVDEAGLSDGQLDPISLTRRIVMWSKATV